MFTKRCLLLGSMAFVIATIITSTELRSQTTAGLFNGTVTDSSGAVLPDAQIEAVNRDTGVQRKVTTDGNGHFTIPEMPPGIYDVSVSKNGFAKVLQKGVQLEVNQSESLNYKLTVSAATQTVQVNGDIATVDSTDATPSEVITQTAIAESPKPVPPHSSSWQTGV